MRLASTAASTFRFLGHISTISASTASNRIGIVSIHRRHEAPPKRHHQNQLID